MKKIAFAIGALVCAVIIGPKIVGGIVEDKYNNIAERYKEHPSIEIKERSYTNQWFGGESIVHIQLKGMSSELDNFTVIVTEQLSYGPVIFNDSGLFFSLAHSNADMSLVLPSEGLSDSPSEKAARAKIEQFIQILNGKLSIASTIDYGMDYTTYMSLEEIIHEEDGKQIKIGKIESEFVLVDEKKIKGFFNWDGINFSGAGSIVDIAPVTITFDQNVIDGDIYAGNALMSGDMSVLFSHIKANDAAGVEMFMINDLSFSAVAEINEELMDVNFSYKAKEFKGAGQDLKDANIAIAINHLDPKILIELNQALTQYQIDPSAVPVQSLIEIATKLLVNNPEVVIKDLSVVTPTGSIKSDLKVVVDHTRYNNDNPMSIIGALTADAKGKIPADFLQPLGLDGVADMYVNQGLIIRDKNELSFDAQFSQGKLTVNGNVIPL